MIWKYNQEQGVGIMYSITDSFLSQQLSAVSSKEGFQCLILLQFRNSYYIIINTINFINSALYLFCWLATGKSSTLNIHVETKVEWQLAFHLPE